MSHEIIRIDKINREAQAAARLPGDLNHHCPYPFGSDAAHAFKAFFNVARVRIDAHQNKTQTQTAQEVVPS